MTQDEIQGDLDATDRDIERLSAIVENLRGFIADSHGEVRFLPFKADLFRYEGLLATAQALRGRIQSKLEVVCGPS